MAADEFEIKQVDSGRNSSRSLVFKISKRINKTSKQQRMAAGHNETSNNPDVSPEPNLRDKHLNEAGGPLVRNKSEFAKPPVLRRTSKRIVLRVREQNIEVKDKTAASQKENPSSGSMKQGSSCGKMGRYKGGRKPLSEAVNPKPERRGRGRPRTVNRDQPAAKVEKIVSIKSSKTPKKLLCPADNSSVWTLVPKKFVNSDYFKSHILKMQARPPRGRRPKKTSAQIPFSVRENVKVQFPKGPLVTTKSAIEQQPLPSRPTVIYFNGPKNGLEVSSSVSQQTSSPDQQQAAQLLHFSSHIRQSNQNAAFGSIYGVSQRYVKRNEHLMRDITSERKQIPTECNSHSDQQHFLPPHQENNMESGNELVFQANGYDTGSVQSGCYISCRQVVVDAIRMLYDEESILGYA